MTILEYLAKVRLTSRQFALMIEVSPSTISRYIEGTRVMDIVMAQKIMEGSRGKITFKGLLSTLEGYEYLSPRVKLPKDEDLL